MNLLLLKSIATGMLLVNISGAPSMATLASAIYGSPASVAQARPDALGNWLNKLAIKESEGKNHLKMLDHNNQYSYGCLQFQMQTFKSYIRKYGLLQDAEDAELENMIYDCDFQKILARTMIQDDYTNWRNWYTSATKKIGLPPKPENTELALADQGGLN